MKFKVLPLVTAVSLALSSAVILADGHGKDHAQYKTQASQRMLAKTNQFWWPESINLSPLRAHSVESNPYGDDFDYRQAFAKIDLTELKRDIQAVLTDSQPWWPADWGNYGPFFIRMAWHSAGTYRVSDGRGGAGGGQQRFNPLNSWPDNGNLDKARRLLWPVKEKYGRSVSWADLMVLAGNVALESMGFKTYGFAGGREDDWEPDYVYWGPEAEFHGNERYKGDRQLAKPLAAVQMGLIYVNPEGPDGVPDPLLAAKDIRETFARMAMNDEETVALIAGGHSFGKAHGAHDPAKCLGPEPGAAGLEEQGLGWKNKCGKGHSEDTLTSGLEGAWTATPTSWSMQYLAFLFNYEWVQTKSPAGATQWIPKNAEQAKIVPDAHIPGKMNTPIMFTTDLSLKFDPAYREISQRFLNNPKEFEAAFARAWFKLTHRDMGPIARYVNSDLPATPLLWQDPVPAVDHPLVTDKQIAQLKQTVLATGLSNAKLVKAAWASAASFRGTDMRGGANGARIRLAPMNSWEVNNPAELAQVLTALEKVQANFNQRSGRTKISMADLIVLAGAAAIEDAAKRAGHDIEVPFVPGRTDASQEWTDEASFAHLEPKADPFRNYHHEDFYLRPVDAMVDRANLLNLSVPEMTVLLGGMRTLNTNYDNSQHGVFTQQPGNLSPDYFRNLLDMSYEWRKSDKPGMYNGLLRGTEEVVWTATPVDLAIGSSAELRAIAEVYAAKDGTEKFYQDFIDAWVKVMRNDRFDL